jgi:predicted acylesterase/phospholipase RssA
MQSVVLPPTSARLSWLIGLCLFSFVSTTSKEVRNTVNLRTYSSRRGSSDLFKATRIWEAARATSAATTFFDPIKVGPHGEEFVDGATGANNPVNEVWSEAADVWNGIPLQGNIKGLVSIGTGVPSVGAFGDGFVEIGRTLLAIATDTENTAEIFLRHHSDLDDEHRYFRFNVRRGLEKIGLEDSKQLKTIAAATRKYLESETLMKQLKTCAASLADQLCK